MTYGFKNNIQRRSQNLNEKNSNEIVNINDVTTNDVIQRNQHLNGKKLEFHSNH